MTSLVPSSPSDSGSPTPSSSRKRPRSETSSEERKEARAHRNRIAAQNSRDRRKAQFAYLERRVAELEDENRALRAARGIPLLPVVSAHERENEELRERIKTLERGWDAVLKALATQAVPLAPKQQQQQQPTPPPTLPISPAPSHASLDSPEPTPHESTRHLARVALTTEPDDATIENLFMEILASPLPAQAPTSPSPAAATLTRSAAQPAGSATVPPEAGPATEVASDGLPLGIVDLGAGVDTNDVVDLGLMNTDEHEGWDSGLEMQRILAALGVVGEEQHGQGLSDLELELGWTTFGGEGTGVGVF